jgi:hypothetical protein
MKDGEQLTARTLSFGARCAAGHFLMLAVISVNPAVLNQLPATWKSYEIQAILNKNPSFSCVENAGAGMA